ncbi:MAG: hypothetical protein ACYSR1_10745 [Planctomycetota bacterium]
MAKRSLQSVLKEVNGLMTITGCYLMLLSTIMMKVVIGFRRRCKWTIIYWKLHCHQRN